MNEAIETFMQYGAAGVGPIEWFILVMGSLLVLAAVGGAHLP